MKNLFFVLAIVFIFGISACGQSHNKEVPEKVKTAFSYKFPDAKKIKWDKENDQLWEAEFINDGKEFSANFDSDGNCTETEYEISTDEIPTSVKSTLEIEFKGYKIEESEISETVNGKLYEFELEQGESSIEVAINIDGKIIKKEIIEEEDEDEND